jgi:hypothetical protein
MAASKDSRSPAGASISGTVGGFGGLGHGWCLDICFCCLYRAYVIYALVLGVDFECIREV